MNPNTIELDDLFETVQTILKLFNKRIIPGEEPCECHSVKCSIMFSRLLGDIDNPWVGRIASEALGTHVFKGTWKEITGDIMRTLRDISLGILEEMMVNWIEWYPDMEDHRTIVTEYNKLKNIRGDFL